jgi:DNA-directed RNA polymerase subunit RPC12/RpoP
MATRVLCPHCDESFSFAGSGPETTCPACSEKVPVAPAAVAAKSLGLQVTCPSCGEKVPGGKRTCARCGASFRDARSDQAEDKASGFAPEKAGIRKGVLGGVIMIVIAAVWFFVGLSAGRVFFYPPILAVIGIYSVIKGLATGNYAGGKSAVRRPPRNRGGRIA